MFKLIWSSRLRRSAGSGPSSPHPRPEPLCCHCCSSGRGWRGSSWTSETPQWPGQERSMTILQSICTKQWWYENQDEHSVSTKIDQEREDKSDNWRACAMVAEMIQCSSFQKNLPQFPKWLRQCINWRPEHRSIILEQHFDVQHKHAFDMFYNRRSQTFDMETPIVNLTLDRLLQTSIQLGSHPKNRIPSL